MAPPLFLENLRPLRVKILGRERVPGVYEGSRAPLSDPRFSQLFENATSLSREGYGDSGPIGALLRWDRLPALERLIVEFRPGETFAYIAPVAASPRLRSLSLDVRRCEDMRGAMLGLSALTGLTALTSLELEDQRNNCARWRGAVAAFPPVPQLEELRAFILPLNAVCLTGLDALRSLRSLSLDIEPVPVASSSSPRFGPLSTLTSLTSLRVDMSWNGGAPPAAEYRAILLAIPELESLRSLYMAGWDLAPGVLLQAPAELLFPESLTRLGWDVKHARTLSVVRARGLREFEQTCDICVDLCFGNALRISRAQDVSYLRDCLGPGGVLRAAKSVFVETVNSAHQRHILRTLLDARWPGSRVTCQDWGDGDDLRVPHKRVFELREGARWRMVDSTEGY